MTKSFEMTLDVQPFIDERVWDDVGNLIERMRNVARCNAYLIIKVRTLQEINLEVACASRTASAICGGCTMIINFSLD